MADARRPQRPAVPLSDDIWPEWLNVIRRLQSVAKAHNQGLAVVRIAILVNAEGKPINWSEPSRTLLEPKSAQQAMLDLLAQ